MKTCKITGIYNPKTRNLFFVFDRGEKEHSTYKAQICEAGYSVSDFVFFADLTTQEIEKSKGLNGHHCLKFLEVTMKFLPNIGQIETFSRRYRNYIADILHALFFGHSIKVTAPTIHRLNASNLFIENTSGFKDINHSLLVLSKEVFAQNLKDIFTSDIRSYLQLTSETVPSDYITSEDSPLSTLWGEILPLPGQLAQGNEESEELTHSDFRLALL